MNSTRNKNKSGNISKDMMRVYMIRKQMDRQIQVVSSLGILTLFYIQEDYIRMKHANSVLKKCSALDSRVINLARVCSLEKIFMTRLDNYLYHLKFSDYNNHSLVRSRQPIMIIKLILTHFQESRRQHLSLGSVLEDAISISRKLSKSMKSKSTEWDIFWTKIFQKVSHKLGSYCN